MTTIEEVFRPQEPSETEQKAQSTLKEKMAARMDKPNGNGANGHATPPFDVKEPTKADDRYSEEATSRAARAVAAENAINSTATVSTEPAKPVEPKKSEYRLWLESELDQHNTAVKGIDDSIAAITVYQANNAIVRTGTETSVIEQAHVTKNGKSDPERVVATLRARSGRDDRDWVNVYARARTYPRRSKSWLGSNSASKKSLFRRFFSMEVLMAKARKAVVVTTEFRGVFFGLRRQRSRPPEKIVLADAHAVACTGRRVCTECSAWRRAGQARSAGSARRFQETYALENHVRYGVHSRGNREAGGEISPWN